MGNVTNNWRELQKTRRICDKICPAADVESSVSAER